MAKKNVFIIGAKGIPARYGGFESFVEQLTKRKDNENIHYYVSCRRDLSENKSNFFEYNNASCFNVDVPNIGAAKAILYDIRAFQQAIKIIKRKKIKQPIVYVLACRIGPFIGYLKKKLKRYDGKLFVNPDGHEWLREKWSIPVRKYWKYSEKLMVKFSDLLICDSKNIERYIKSNYSKFDPFTIYIAYGSDVEKSDLDFKSKIVENWYRKFSVRINNYYLIVGRFVPENNYETMIKEYMNSNTEKDLVIISNVEKNNFYNDLEEKTHFLQDKRIKFVGTVYDSQLLKYIRENAFAYIHGHEVGGTNPSLLEALGSTNLNLLLNVGFNKEVGMASAFYWNKDVGFLSSLMAQVEQLDEKEIEHFGLLAKKRIKEQFDWSIIIKKYESIFLES